jgi:hypothetical protein
MPAMHNLTVLFTAAQWEELASLAEENGTNMSAIASEIIGNELANLRAEARYQQIEAEEFNRQCSIEKELKTSFLDNWSDDEISSEERNACDHYNERFVTSVW